MWSRAKKIRSPLVWYDFIQGSANDQIWRWSDHPCSGSYQTSVDPIFLVWINDQIAPLWSFALTPASICCKNLNYWQIFVFMKMQQIGCTLVPNKEHKIFSFTILNILSGIKSNDGARMHHIRKLWYIFEHQTQYSIPDFVWYFVTFMLSDVFISRLANITWNDVDRWDLIWDKWSHPVYFDQQIS